ncbi:hypothetical protein [Endozoicomonas ascidiicola]|uniref:hypothetical protein n=1 Tax=Endozoicomonas ascidiicola TaxID=1698521 RepID=UPI0008358CE0|nr:hypothetical protein [Endozoicomonas ascidiicola]
MDRLNNNGLWGFSHNRYGAQEPLNEGRFGVHDVTVANGGESITGRSPAKFEVYKFDEKFIFSKEELLNDEDLIAQFQHERKMTGTAESIRETLKSTPTLFAAFTRLLHISNTTQDVPRSERPGTSGLQRRHVDVAIPPHQPVRNVVQNPPEQPRVNFHGYGRRMPEINRNVHVNNTISLVNGVFTVNGERIPTNTEEGRRVARRFGITFGQNNHVHIGGGIFGGVIFGGGIFGGGQNAFHPNLNGQRSSRRENSEQSNNGYIECHRILTSISESLSTEQRQALTTLIQRIERAQYRQSDLFRKFLGVLNYVQSIPEFIEKVVATINTIQSVECQDKTSAVIDQLDLEVQLARLPEFALSYGYLDYPKFFVYLKKMYNEEVLIKVMTTVKDRQNKPLINNPQSVHVKAFLKNYFIRQGTCKFATGEAIERYQDHSRRSGLITDELLDKINLEFVLKMDDKDLFQQYLNSLLLETSIDQNPLVDFLTSKDEKLRGVLDRSSEQGMDLMQFEQVAGPSNFNLVDFSRNMVTTQSMAKNQIVSERVMTQLEQYSWGEIIRQSNE